MKIKSAKIAACIAFVILLLFLGSFCVFPSAHAGFAPPSGWQSYYPVTLTETAGVDRVDEPVGIPFAPVFGECSSVNEIRVIAPDGVTEIPSQVYDVVTSSGYITSCRVVFLANVPALDSAAYYIIYNNPGVGAPTYDGLRLHTEFAGDTYNVTALVTGVENNYFRLLWKHLVDMYSDGELVCWPGGPAGWEFAQITLASLWSDGADNPWFSVGDIVTVANSGPLFVEFNITQPFACDLWATVFNYNVSTTYMVRVYYQPDLNPLVGYHMSQSFKQNDIVRNPLVVDFKLANSTSYEIYQDFTWKNQDQEVTTVSAKDDMPQIDSIWSAAKPYGWLSYNGSIPGMPDKPAANIGLIPTYAGGTSQSVNYVVNFTATYPDTIQEPYFDHHCTTQLSAVTNGVKGDVIESKGFIKVYPFMENAEPTMSNIVMQLRSPLEVIPGDVNRDGIVNILDGVIIAVAFGSRPGDPKWNPIADIITDNIINIQDILLWAIHFGETW